MTCLGNSIIISAMFIVLLIDLSIQTASAAEIDVKRGYPVCSITPVPRRRSDPDFVEWEREINANSNDDYECGEYSGNEFVRPYFGFSRISRAGSRMYGATQRTAKRSASGGGAVWCEPHFGQMQ